jgi:hypothetical protein
MNDTKSGMLAEDPAKRISMEEVEKRYEVILLKLEKGKVMEEMKQFELFEMF